MNNIIKSGDDYFIIEKNSTKCNCIITICSNVISNISGRL